MMGYLQHDDYNPDDPGYFGADADERGLLEELPPLPAVERPLAGMAAWPLPTSVDGGGDGQVADAGVAGVEVPAEGEANSAADEALIDAALTYATKESAKLIMSTPRDIKVLGSDALPEMVEFTFESTPQETNELWLAWAKARQGMKR